MENGHTPSKEELGIPKEASLIEALSFELQQKYIQENGLSNPGAKIYDFETGILAHEPRELEEDEVPICLVSDVVIMGTKNMQEEWNRASFEEQRNYMDSLRQIINTMEVKQND